jgi:hypothetical protein
VATPPTRTTTDLSPLAQRVVDAYGGAERWNSATAVEATVTARGFAFLARTRGGIHNMSVRAEIARPYVTGKAPGKREVEVLDGNSVRIEDAAGNVIASRDDPRRFFPGGRRTFRWDRLDAAFFSGYALWNYLTFPALLLRKDITWKQVSDTTLEASFPPELPTHSPVQQFHFHLETALLRQHDYTAKVFGAWAKAANVVLEHGTWHGIPYPSRRRVTPRRPDGTPRPFPLLVGILVKDWRLA